MKHAGRARAPSHEHEGAHVPTRVRNRTRVDSLCVPNGLPCCRAAAPHRLTCRLHPPPPRTMALATAPGPMREMTACAAKIVRKPLPLHVYHRLTAAASARSWPPHPTPPTHVPTHPSWPAPPHRYITPDARPHTPVGRCESPDVRTCGLRQRALQPEGFQVPHPHLPV
jgi:hypothetical protein